ncbi:MAG TPA: methyltransferase domain-containing protein, partial [Flavisolibacter sp.]|nr:methyltransferase domain-containing protein [Flavisolibacter sp.]
AKQEKGNCTVAFFLFSRYLPMHLRSYLLSAQEILSLYKGDVPFTAWLKNYFRLNKKYGSKDRKLIADLCFCYFRLGHAFQQLPDEERLLTGQFLCHEESPFLQQFKPDWMKWANLSVEEKIKVLDEAQLRFIFPFETTISHEIEKELFALSFLQQPDLFLRIRPGNEKQVLRKLQQAGLSFVQEGFCLRLPNATKIEELLRIDEEVVVQDLSSQQVLTDLLSYLTNVHRSLTVWDCCAASGGKTILLHDQFSKARLTVSDIRESILVNLNNRFKRAGIQHYQSFVVDVSKPQFSLSQSFDLIICDAPCSGSGTWARTPEHLHFFPQEKIEQYASLQKRIASNASKSLKPGGYFLYITCSVFQKENEEVVNYLQQQAGLQPLSQRYFKGYDQKADTLFAALFTTS